MSTQTLDAARLWTLLSQLPLSTEERGELSNRVTSGIPGFCTRSVVLDSVPNLVRSLKPNADLAVFDVVRDVYPRGTLFSFSPIEGCLILYTLAGRTVFPDKELNDACISFVRSIFSKLLALPIFGPVVLACEDKPQNFMDLSTSTATQLFFSGGEAEHERLTQRSSRIHYDGYPVRIMEPLFLGFYQGLIKHMTGEDPTHASFEVFSNAQGELNISW